MATRLTTSVAPLPIVQALARSAHDPPQVSARVRGGRICDAARPSSPLTPPLAPRAAPGRRLRATELM